MPEENEYPPQFASSDLSALLGQINDFAGVPPPPPPPPGPMELKSAKATSKTGPAPAAAPDLSKLLAGEYSLPVTIVGSAAQRGPYLPGLRDQLIGVTIFRLAEQIVDPSLKSSAQKIAQELIHSGSSTLASHVSKLRKKAK